MAITRLGKLDLKKNHAVKEESARSLHGRA